VGGYDAIEFSPPNVGTYYIEFQRLTNNFPPGPSTGTFTIDLFDITVANTTSSTAIPGRLYSHAWQFAYAPLNADCSAKFYVYSSDSIITSLQLNQMDGRWWYLFCNQTGVGNTGDFEQDRKSVDYAVSFPQYRIFVNEPDTNLFPPANTLGEIIPPILGQTHCIDGSIDFLVEVDKSGNVEIELIFPPPYATRTLTKIVEAGVNTLSWDGYDGASPDSLAVPNNTNITFTVSYINGLTNLPLFDVENNDNGFVIELVNPPLGPNDSLLVFWDDSNLGGTTNLTGCYSVPDPWSGCHPWPNGNTDTYNTWWYAASESTAPVVLVQERGPDSLIFDQPTQNYCAGSSGDTISVGIDPNTEIYNWDFTGNDVTITQTNPSDNFITFDLGPLATTGDIMVWGTNANCGDGDTSYLFIGIQELPIADAGLDDTICINQTITLAGDSIHSSSVLWETNGDGIYSNSTILNPIYTPGAGDFANGFVELYLSAFAITPCTGFVQDTMLLTFDPLPVADAGNDTTICENGMITLAGDTLHSNGVLWTSSGDGNFDDATLINATYTPGPLDITNLSAVLTLTADSPCAITDQDDMTLTVDPLPVADAGSDDTICVNQDITLSGGLTNSNTSLWTTLGNGIFDDASLQNATYTLGSNDIAAGFVELILTADPIIPCADSDQDTMLITITPIPIVDPGVDSTICENNSLILYGDTTYASTVTWSTGGDGFFSDDQLIDAVYTPGTADIANGSVYLTLTAFAELPCTTPSQDSLLLSFYPLPIPDAGIDSTICENGTLTLYGDSTFATTVLWSTQGNGTFDDATLINATYTPGSNDTTAGFVELVLTANPEFPCTDSRTDTMMISFDPLPIADANNDEVICVNQDITLSGFIFNSDAGFWATTGDGTFDDANLLDATYSPGSNDLIAGFVELILTANPRLACADSDQDTMMVVFTPLPIVMPGADSTICENNTLILYGDTTYSSTVTWSTGGDGTFNDAQLINAEYFPGIADIANGAVYLTLTAFAEMPCTTPSLDSLLLSFYPLPIPDAGIDSTICENGTIILYGDTTFASTVSWLTLGNGTFDDVSLINATYTPGSNDLLAGSVIAKLTQILYPSTPFQ